MKVSMIILIISKKQILPSPGKIISTGNHFNVEPSNEVEPSHNVELLHDIVELSHEVL